ncbi:MAG: hypothetical protein LBE99_00930 [Puniceicoccales bacterium]|jgi:hypothetical protein|nr:hypothetical protein [Puniceicoccales bacterium]
MDDNIKIAFNLIFPDKRGKKFEFPIFPNRSEIVFDIGILPSVPQKVDIIISNQALGKILWKDLDPSQVPVEFSSKFFNFDLRFDFYIPPPIDQLPTLLPEAPKTVLGLIRYEQFYNNHQKLLLQVGDGTSLEDTIRLHNQMFPHLGSRIERAEDFIIDYIYNEDDPIANNGIIDNLVTVAKSFNINLLLRRCDAQGKEIYQPLLFSLGSTEDRPIEIVQDVKSSIYFLVVDPDGPISDDDSESQQCPQAEGGGFSTPVKDPGQRFQDSPPPP